MPIDTREKRMSMLNFGEGSYSHVGFESDAAVNQDDRQHLLDCYSGILFTDAVPTLSKAGGGYVAASYFGLVSPPVGA